MDTEHPPKPSTLKEWLQSDVSGSDNYTDEIAAQFLGEMGLVLDETLDCMGEMDPSIEQAMLRAFRVVSPWSRALLWKESPDIVTAARRNLEDERHVRWSLGRFEDWTPEQVAYLIEELADGMARDWRSAFDGYWGAAAALRVASAYVERGDSPEANEAATAEIGILVRYALDSWYWGNDAAPVHPDDCDPEHRPLVLALEGIERAASPIVTATGTRDWNERQQESDRCVSA